MRRIAWLLPVVFLFVGCGKKASSSAAWPARLVAVNKFSDDQKSQVMEAVAKLNEGLGRTAVLTTSGDGYPITITLVDPFTDAPLRAGLAAVSDDDCQISISNIVFTDEHQGTVLPVVMHEIGHCDGLAHTLSPTDRELMSPITHSLSQYDTVTLARFFKSFLDTGHL